MYVLGRKLPVCNCHVCFLCHILGWRLALVSVTVFFSQELLGLAEDTGASGQGLRFQEEPKGVRQGAHVLLSAPLGLHNSPPVNQFKRRKEGDDSQHKTKHCFNHASSNLLLGTFQS